MEARKNNDSGDDYFKWEMDQTSRIFPIDYTINELVKKSPYSRHAIKTKLIDNPILSKSLYNLGEEGLGTKKYPLPLEAIPFLMCFLEMGEDANYISQMQKTNNPKDVARFSAAFYSKLFKRLFPPR